MRNIKSLVSFIGALVLLNGCATAPARDGAFRQFLDNYAQAQTQPRAQYQNPTPVIHHTAYTTCNSSYNAYGSITSDCRTR